MQTCLLNIGFAYRLAYEFDQGKNGHGPEPTSRGKSTRLGTGRNGSRHQFTCHFKQSEFPSEQNQYLTCICFQDRDHVAIGPVACTVIIHLLLTGLG